MKELVSKKESKSKGPELLAHFGAVLAARLGKEGLPEHKASEVALNVMDVMKLEFGGQLVYFPMGLCVNTEAKAEEIYEKFKAQTSVSDLAQEYGHSIQYVYRLLKGVRDKRRAENGIARRGNKR